MATDARNTPLARLRPRRETVLWGSLLVTLELGVLAAYSLLGSSSLVTLAGARFWLYPLVWINVGLWAVLRTVPAGSGASTRHRWLARALAAGYFGLLAYTGGLVGAGMAEGAGVVRVVWRTIPPGWGPAVTYAGDLATLTLVPYRVVGYLALAYLVYATVLDAARSAVTGVLGLLSCVSCSWPVLASLATGVAGSGTGIAVAVSTNSYGLSTVVFVATVALLYWRPFGSRE
jgi:hypothetical protein